MSKIATYFKDIIKSLMVGIIVSLVLIIISGLCSILVNGNNIKSTLDIMKSTLFIIGAFGLLLFSGFILKRDSRRPLIYEKQWKEKFKIIQFQNVLMFIAAMILCFGLILDRIIYYL